MGIFYSILYLLFGILFFVTLIEYLTGAEKEGFKFFISFIIFILLFSFFFSLKSPKNLVQKLTELIAGVVSGIR